MSNETVAATLRRLVTLLEQQSITLPQPERKRKPKAEPPKAAKPKKKKGATDAQRAYYNAMKISHPCPFRPGLVEREAYRAAKKAGLIG